MCTTCATPICAGAATKWKWNDKVYILCECGMQNDVSSGLKYIRAILLMQWFCPLPEFWIYIICSLESFGSLEFDCFLSNYFVQLSTMIANSPSKRFSLYFSCFLSYILEFDWIFNLIKMIFLQIILKIKNKQKQICLK